MENTILLNKDRFEESLSKYKNSLEKFNSYCNLKVSELLVCKLFEEVLINLENCVASILNKVGVFSTKNSFLHTINFCKDNRLLTTDCYKFLLNNIDSVIKVKLGVMPDYNSVGYVHSTYYTVFLDQLKLFEECIEFCDKSLVPFVDVNMFEDNVCSDINCNLNVKIIKEKIKNCLLKYSIDACLIFGSFGTRSFSNTSDIDLAIISNLSSLDLLTISSEIEDIVGLEVDLLDIGSLRDIFKLQIAFRGDILFCNNENKLDSFISHANNWYFNNYRDWINCRGLGGYILGMDK